MKNSNIIFHDSFVLKDSRISARNLPLFHWALGCMYRVGQKYVYSNIYTIYCIPTFGPLVWSGNWELYCLPSVHWGYL